MATTPRRLDFYRRGDINVDRAEQEAMRRDRRYEEVQDRIVEDYLRQDRDEVLRTMVNDDEMSLSPRMVEVINDPSLEMTPDMKIQRRTPSARSTTRLGGRFQDQFSTGMGFTLPPVKRRRKKTRTDASMSKALKLANAKLRNKNGKLKKGKTMSDVMKMAHRLRKK